MATSWLDHDQYFGASWLVCDSQGLPSRRAFAPIRSSLEASLTSLMWVVEALQDLRVGKVVVELSSAMVPGWGWRPGFIISLTLQVDEVNSNGVTISIYPCHEGCCFGIY
ncbi:hypothetical protein F2Q69_00050419 [Brassica cretica]|uniref:Uncharacterized protein n=1 Tax=Brassica cretica TaxID=69181 RepID=A0A8S9PWY8_BRACR|nr:hypothetical protein F2Q69_00050419 [Brassica cretica]